MKHLYLSFYSFLLFFSAHLCSAHQNLIHKISLENNTLTVTCTQEFQKTFLKNPFFATYDESVPLKDLPLSIVLTPFFNCIAPIVWISGQIIEVDQMDRQQYHSLQKVKRVMQLFYPDVLWSGDIIAKNLIDNTQPSSQKEQPIAVLFSHGLDAVYTSFNNIDKKQILVTICGGDILLENKQLWNGVKKACIHFAQEHNHYPTFVRSNFAYFYKFNDIKKHARSINNWFASVMQGLNYVGLAAPVAYANGCSAIHIGATRTQEYPFAYGTHPAIDCLLSFSDIITYHDGHDADRTQKVATIKTICEQKNLKKPLLRVCWAKDPFGGNCGKCEKCIRTMAEIIAEDDNPQEYGFPGTYNDILSTVTLKSPPQSRLPGGLLWHWGCVVQKAYDLSKKPNKKTHEPGFIHCIKTLAAINLAQYGYTNNAKYSTETKILFTDLWNRALERTLTLEYLDTLIAQSK